MGKYSLPNHIPFSRFTDDNQSEPNEEDISNAILSAIQNNTKFASALGLDSNATYVISFKHS